MAFWLVYRGLTASNQSPDQFTMYAVHVRKCRSPWSAIFRLRPFLRYNFARHFDLDITPQRNVRLTSLVRNGHAGGAHFPALKVRLHAPSGKSRCQRHDLIFFKRPKDLGGPASAENHVCTRVRLKMNGLSEIAKTDVAYCGCQIAVSGPVRRKPQFL
jgi:hypothetical protein